MHNCGEEKVLEVFPESGIGPLDTAEVRHNNVHAHDRSPAEDRGTVRRRSRFLGVQDREILRLAVPAFFALVSEPLMLLADSAIVGHLGTPQLAALGVAGTILQTLVGICVFLAYGTTSAVARRIGAGDHRGALAQGIDGL